MPAVIRKLLSDTADLAIRAALGGLMLAGIAFWICYFASWGWTAGSIKAWARHDAAVGAPEWSE